MYDTRYPIRANLVESHRSAWKRIGEPGAFFSGADRVKILHEARAALDCELCRSRLNALSPNAVRGEHAHSSDLPAVLVDAIHRIRTDSGRITKAMFDAVLASGVRLEQYIEAVSVVTTCVIVDTMHQSMGLAMPSAPAVVEGAPTGQSPPDVVDDGAWVPLSPADTESTELGLTRSPNIARAMGSVPSAVALFFGTFRSHYALRDIPLEISQSQAEFIASRVSALNQCFY